MPFENEDFNSRKVLGVAAALVIFILCLFGILWARQSRMPHPALAEAPPLGSPRGQVEFESGVLQHHWREQQNASMRKSYWRDAGRSVAVVSVERAMKELAAKKTSDPKIIFPGRDSR